MHKVPKLDYSYDSLEPYIDADTMQIHHTKHHQAYVDNLNKAVSGSEFEKLGVRELIMHIDKLPGEMQTAARNHGGGHFNHSFFWPLLRKDTKPGGALARAIELKFGSIDRFKEEFTKSALSVFGSGWAWLVVEDSQLKIMATKNQDSPVMDRIEPVIGLDVWEHAYYLKYQNKRAEYIEAFFNVLDWEQANSNYENILTEVRQ